MTEEEETLKMKKLEKLEKSLKNTRMLMIRTITRRKSENWTKTRTGSISYRLE